MIRGLLTALLLVSAFPAWAHESRPAFLELSESAGNQWSVVWKLPTRGDRVLSLTPVFPDFCTETSRPEARQTGGAQVRRWALDCPQSLVGETVYIENLDSTLTDVLVRVARVDGTVQTARPTPTQPFFIVQAEPGAFEVAGTYFKLGVEHIWGGIDHLLFVFALLLIAKGWRRLVWAITAFTVSHSITLGAATLGFVNVPQGPVEAIIALSIVFLAMEIVHGLRGRSGLAAASPWLVAGSFGLLHGFGFAGALAEVGLPQKEIPLALLFFNVGVEAGQLLFVAAALLGGMLLKNITAVQVRLATTACAYAIGGVAAFWTVERIVGFWG